MPNGDLQGSSIEMGINLCYSHAPTKASVLVLMDSRFVSSREALYTVRDAEAAVREVGTITTYITGSIASGLLDGVTRFVIPELKAIQPSFLDDLSTADRTALKSYVESGAGRLIVIGGSRLVPISGSSNAAALINKIFRFKVEDRIFSSYPFRVEPSTSIKSGDAADTIFKDDAASLAYANNVRCLVITRLPATATSVYLTNDKNNRGVEINRSAVTTFFDNNLVHIGYDWNAGSGTVWANILATTLLASPTTLCLSY